MSGTSSFRQMVARFCNPTVWPASVPSSDPGNRFTDLDEQQPGRRPGLAAPRDTLKAAPASPDLSTAPAPATSLPGHWVESSVWIDATVTSSSTHCAQTTACEIKVAGWCEPKVNEQPINVINVTVINGSQRDGLLLRPPPIDHHHLIRHLYSLP